MERLRKIYHTRKILTTGFAFLFIAIIVLVKTPSAFAFIYGTVFIDTNQNGIQDSQENGYSKATLTATDGKFTSTVSTDNNGDYDFTSLMCPGIYTATLTVPQGYGTTTPASVNNISIVCGGAHLLNFGIALNLTPTPTPIPTYSISGNIFIDGNKNGIIDPDESNYEGNSSISLRPKAGTITMNSDGTYTITNLPAGAYTVSYRTLPTGYRMTSPLNGPPPSFQVIVGAQNCNSNGAPGALCTDGNITKLNFGISNNFPWYQATCGDVRVNNGINDPLPSGQSMITTNNYCSSPGIAFTGDANANVGQGQVSSTNQIVGGELHPEVYSPSSGVLSTSYSYLLAKAQNAGIPTTPLYSVCNTTSCTLPANLPHGIYVAPGDVTLNAFTFPANQNYVFLINGNLTITGTTSVPIGSTALFATSGNITVEPTVGTAANTTTATLSGWYIAGQSFILPTQSNCTDLRLNIAGALVVNAQGDDGILQNSRDLCANDAEDPTLTFQPRLDFFLNAPQFLEQQQTTSQEATP